MSSRSRLVAPLLLSVLAALALGPAPASAEPEAPVPQAIPPTCDVDCPPETTYVHEATLTVSRSGGTVTSDTHDGHAINCGSTCSVTDQQETFDPVFPTDGWHTYTLTATGGPSGYAPSWTGCDSVVQSQCQVANDSEGGTAVSLSWVDVTAPSLSFTPPAKVGPSGYNVSASGFDNSGAVAAYVWTVDNVVQANSGPVLSLGGFPEGDRTVSVRARDHAGNHSSTVARTVTVDKHVALTVEPLDAYVAGPPLVSFTTAQDVVARSCWAGPADQAPVWASCTSPWQVPGPLADGSYEVAVKVTDDVGNSATVVQEVVVDSVAPVLTFQDGPADGSTQEAATATFSFTVSDDAPVDVTCTLDGEPLQCAPATPVELSDLAPGPHTFGVTAQDAAGNLVETSRSFTRRVPTSLTAKAVDRTVPRGKRAVLLARGLPAAATGKVVFKRRDAVLCTATVKDGRAECRTSRTLKPGRYDAEATYRGAAGYASSSDTFRFRVLR